MKYSRHQTKNNN